MSRGVDKPDGKLFGFGWFVDTVTEDLFFSSSSFWPFGCVCLPGEPVLPDTGMLVDLVGLCSAVGNYITYFGVIVSSVVVWIV